MAKYVPENLRYIWDRFHLDRHWFGGHAKAAERFWTVEEVKEGEFPSSALGFIQFTDNYEEHIEWDGRAPKFLDIMKLDALPPNYWSKRRPDQFVLVITKELRSGEDIFGPREVEPPAQPPSAPTPISQPASPAPPTPPMAPAIKAVEEAAVHETAFSNSAEIEAVDDDAREDYYGEGIDRSNNRKWAVWLVLGSMIVWIILKVSL